MKQITLDFPTTKNRSEPAPCEAEYNGRSHGIVVFASDIFKEKARTSKVRRNRQISSLSASWWDR